MLGHVFVRLRQWLLPTGATTASSTQSAGPVCPEHTILTGNPCSAETTSHQPQLANLAALQNSEAAQSTSVEVNSGNETPLVSTTKKSKVVGTKQETPAPRTHQLAKPAQKPKSKAAKQGTSGKKHTRGKASAPTRTARRSGDSGT